MADSRPLYFDHAATTPLRDEARAALLEQLDAGYANASSQHAFGRRAHAALTAARRTIATLLGAGRDDVTFTGNGSEANLLALVGACRGLPAERRHVLVSPIEHPSVLEPLEALVKAGEIELERLPVDRWGRIDPADVVARLRPTTGLVSVMLANHELGTLEPVGALAAALRNAAKTAGAEVGATAGVLLHTDASQALGKVSVRMDELGVDLLTGAAHKFGGPRGVGLLIARPGIRLVTPLSPGRQEQGRRGGTEDVAACVSTAAALLAAESERALVAARLEALTRHFEAELAARLPTATLHSASGYALPGLINFSLPTVDGSWLVAALDQRGVAVSHGAACASLAALPSPVLVAIGAADRSRNSVRISMGRTTTRDDVDLLLSRLVDVVVAIEHGKTFSTSQDRGNSMP